MTWLRTALVTATLAAVTQAHVASSERVAILVPIGAEASWRDDAFLAAVPAAATLGGGEPIALAVDAAAPWRPELLDFLERYEPTRLLWVGEAPPAPPLEGLVQPEVLPCATAAEASAALARVGWVESKRVVLFDSEDRSAALAASALAARLGEPLLPVRDGVLEPAASETLGALGASRALFVGDGERPRLDGVRVEVLKDAEAVVRWLERNRHAVDYLAAVNPREEVGGRVRHLTLAAPLLAAGRSGAVAPLAFATRWKQRFDVTEELGVAPDGVAPSTAGWRRGTISLDGASTSFVNGRDPADGRWWLQLDRDGDGRFDGEDEQPVRTGESFALGERQWTADHDAEEKANGKAVWLCSPTAAEVRAELARYRAAADEGPRFLCLIGWPEALPMAVIGHGQGIDADLVSDLPFGQTDEDPFVELSLARFIAEDLPSATLLACRGFARDDLPGQSWRGRFATAEWAATERGALEAAGLDFAGNHDGAAPIDSKSELVDAGVIVHGSHAAWTTLGATYTWDSEVLLAPALVESSGCSTASLDQDAEHRSVAARLLRNGAVAFVGNARRGIAQGNLFRTELWNALLEGATLGEAQRVAQNRSLVAVLEKGQAGGGLDYYQLYGYAVYGDPALQLDLVRPDAETPAGSEQRGAKVTVHGPERWRRVEYTPNEEWGCAFPRLYTWSAPGVAIESSWYGPEKRNEDVSYLHVEARTRRRMTTVEPLDEVEAPLGWTGSCFVDEHADGSRSLYWRVRLFDGDMTTGEVRAQVDLLRFRLLAK